MKTRLGRTVYVHVLDWSGQEKLVLPPLDAKVIKASLLGGGHAAVKQNATGLEVSVAPSQRQPLDTIVVLKLDRSAAEISPK